MKKHGFTLAEVLVTLGIIGVVAALTTPALIQNVGNAKVGPKLKKAVATFETASEMLLTEQNANSLLGVASDSEGLGDALAKYMKINYVSGSNSNKQIPYKEYSGTDTFHSHYADNIGQRYDSDEGMIYYIKNDGTRGTVHGEYANVPNNQYIGDVWVDINGSDGPNTIGKDMFKFALFNDGTLRPWGAKAFLRHVSSSGLTQLWSGSTDTCDESHVKGSGASCTGSIFDHGMKIVY